MLLAFLIVILSLTALVWSADKFVEGAAALAKRLGLSSFFIGLVIVGFGTSAPELLVSVISAVQGKGNLALGNAYGSNIVNIALVLGLAALFFPVFVAQKLLKKEFLALLAISVLAIIQAVDGQITRLEAVVLLGVFGISMFYTFMQARQAQDASSNTEQMPNLSLLSACFWLVFGLSILLLSSHFLVTNSVLIAQMLGVSDLVIGLTLVAVGTSLPELAATLTALRKGENQMALGNILGSNFFNALAVVGTAALIQPLKFGAEVLERDLVGMLLITLLLGVLGWAYTQKQRQAAGAFLGKFAGIVLLLSYSFYLKLLLVS